MGTKTRLVRSRFVAKQNILIEKKETMPHCTLHCHDFYEFELITRGVGITRLNGTEYKVREGMAVLLSPRDFHEYISEKPIELYNIQFTADSIDSAVIDIFSSPKTYIEYLDANNAAHISSLCGIISETEKSGDSPLCMSKLLEALLALFGSHFNEKANETLPSPPIAKAIMYIQAHFKENPSLEETANHVYLNPRYFCTLFKTVVGVNYKSYLKNIKLKYAEGLIVSSNLPITEIAYESGYTSISHFNREYLSFYGESPSATRKKKNRASK